MAKKMLTGFRPTGKLHLGHLHGNIKNMLENQKKYENFFFLVDWHALSTEYQNPGDIKKNLIFFQLTLINRIINRKRERAIQINPLFEPV